MDNNVTVISKICQYAYNQTDIKTCKYECICHNINTDMDCGNLTNTIFCNTREDRDFSLPVFGTYGLVMLIAIGTLFWHIKTRFFIQTFVQTQNDIKNNPDSDGPTLIAKFLTMQWCKTKYC